MSQPNRCAVYHIVCTDATSDGEIERRIIERAGSVFSYRPCRSVEELGPAGEDADVLLVGYLPVGGELLRGWSRLKVVCSYSTGVDHIDIPVATALGIWVCNAGDYCSEEVADHTMALILAAWRHLVPFREDIHRGIWRYDSAGPIRPLQGATLGLIGLGRIGQRVARRAAAFGMWVIGYDPYVLEVPGVERVTFEELLARSDIISLHVPGRPEGPALLDATAFSRMKEGVWVVNVSRAGLIDLEAARAALAAGRLGGLALDVWDPEPPTAIDPLFAHPRVLVTPHAGWFSTRSNALVRERVAEEALRVLSGQMPSYAVNRPSKPRIPLAR
ncbi:MAG: C-terminal binding protein [Chloroflexia bacterium]